MKKIRSIMYDIVLLFLGCCLGAIIMYWCYNRPAYPGPGDWNGDGVLSIADLFYAINELIHGPTYPEYVIG